MEAGTDVLENSRFLHSINRNEGRLRERLFTPEELASAKSPLDLAVIFSAKESIVKALGTGFDEGLSWHDIRIDLREEELRAELFRRARELASGRDLLLSFTRSEERTITCALLSERG